MADRALVERDKEFWSTRVRALSSLAAADAVAVVLPLTNGRYFAFAEHNVGRDAGWLEGAAQHLILSAVKLRTVQRSAETQVTLGDGRTANSIVVAPIPWEDRIIGALVALRTAPAYEPGVGAPPADLAQLVGLELAVSSVLQRSTLEQRSDDGEQKRALEDRRHAIVLYEISRLGLRPGPPEGAAALVADALDCGLVGVWVDEDGWLALADGHGYDGEPARVRLEDDATLQRVVEDGVTQRIPRGANGEAPWMGAASEVIAAPLAGGLRGMLVLGQPTRPFSAADLTLAPTLAETIGLARARRALTARTARSALPAAPAASGASEEPAARATPTWADLERAAEAERTPVAPASAAASSANATEPALPEPAVPARSRRGWVIPLFVIALAAAGVGAFLGEPLIFILAGLLLLVAFWGWLAE
jgi:hypothetical protein